MKRRIVPLVVLTFVLILVLIPRAAQVEGQALSAPIGTAFTYQGKLMDGGAPANGVYDLTFTLYDAPSGGSQVGTTSIVDDVSVTEGLFTVQLDFGAVFNGTALYLEIGVRPGSGGAFVTLSPRQAITSAPYASRADQVPWSGITGMPAGFADGDDDGEVYTAGTGLSLTSGAFGIDDTYQLPQSCSNGQIPQWNGTAWECTVQNSYSAGTGLSLNTGQMSITDTYQLPQSCSNGQVPQWNGSAWACVGQNTYTAGTGLSLTGGQMSLGGTYQLPQTCSNGQIAGWNGSGWICANDSGATYTAGDGITITSNVIASNFAGTGAAATVSRSDHTHSGYLASGTAAGGDLTGAYPNPTIASNAVGSAEIVDDSVDMADMVNWIYSGTDSDLFSSTNAAGYIYLYGPSFTPSADGKCLVMADAWIVSTGNASSGYPPTLDTFMYYTSSGTTVIDPASEVYFSPGDVTNTQPISASANWAWNVTGGQTIRFGCRVSDPDGQSGSDWGSDEAARCRIAYICQ